MIAHRQMVGVRGQYIAAESALCGIARGDTRKLIIGASCQAEPGRESDDYNLRGGFESEHVESLVLAQT